jgi:hypothetical protein
LDRKLLAELRRTKGDLSESERVNRLLHLALEVERRAALEQEIAEFFAGERPDRGERRAFQSAALKTWARES